MALYSNRIPRKKNIGRYFGIMIICWAFCAAVVLALPSHGSALSSKDKFFIAENCYKSLRNDPSRQKYRDQWMRCIDKYQDVFRNDPMDPWAPAGLYMSGVLYHELFMRSGSPSDKKEALDNFERTIKRYPSSKYKERDFDSRKSIIMGEKNQVSEAKVVETKKSLKAQTIKKEIDQKDTDSPVALAADLNRETDVEIKTASQKNSQGDKTIVSGLRYWSNPNYTRVVIDADTDTHFEGHLLKPDPNLNTPRRLYVDVANARLGKDMERVVPINDDLLNDARAGQYTHETVRIVVDIKTFSKYKIFPLKNPFRIVIDVWGTEESSPGLVEKTVAIPEIRDEKMAPGSLTRQLALGVSRIVIDPGHGGRDSGAPGAIKGVYEKQIVLEIAKRLARRIEKELGCEVFLTRSDDRFLTLEERTAIANTKEADLFISLHTNASMNRNASGIETYFLNLTTDEESIRVAARENATSRKNISDLQAILNDLMQNAKINESARLAAFVQNSMVTQLGKSYSMISDKGVKQAPFYVLLGAQMPSILVEASFISNPKECERLMDPEYQEHISRGITEGIRHYIKNTDPVSIMTAAPVIEK
jgi:N-acetylmuramoyl-L-alanine amidase